MKLVHLTVAVLIAAFFAVAPRGVCGQGAEDSAMSCSPSCKGGRGTDCCHRDCLVGRYGYGKAPICEKAKEGEPCQVHGRGPCPEERIDFGLGLRQAFAPVDRPYFGMQPLLQPRPPVPHEYYGGRPHGAGIRNVGAYAAGPHGAAYPPPQPRFPVLRSFFVQPPIYMTTEPQPPMPTYTTRGPRDFLHPNPPSIGY